MFLDDVLNSISATFDEKLRLLLDPNYQPSSQDRKSTEIRELNPEDLEILSFKADKTSSPVIDKQNSDSNSLNKDTSRKTNSNEKQKQQVIIGLIVSRFIS